MKTKIKRILVKVCKTFNLGTLASYEKEISSQNNVYKVETTKGTYIVKEFTKDAIGNYYYLNKRKKQIKIAEHLSKHNINCILPKRIHHRHFFSLNKKYYLVYDYSESKVLDEEEYTIEHVKVLAKTQGLLHRLNLKVALPCTYKKINIDLDRLITMAKGHTVLLNLLLKNRNKLEALITTCNKNIALMKKNLCISHNDYKHKNVLWKNLTPTLIDFDASGLSNPTCCLCESALTFSRKHYEINYDYYKAYLESYLAIFPNLKEDYKTALYVSMNGKLQWYNYMISKKDYDGITSMTKEFLLLYDNIDKFYEIYKSVK